MKISYDREVDVLTIETSHGDIDHAEEAGPMIIHLTRDNKPVLIEILDASDFLASLTKISAKQLAEMQLRSNRSLDRNWHQCFLSCLRPLHVISSILQPPELHQDHIRLQDPISIGLPICGIGVGHSCLDSW